MREPAAQTRRGRKLGCGHVIVIGAVVLAVAVLLIWLVTQRVPR